MFVNIGGRLIREAAIIVVEPRWWGSRPCIRISLNVPDGGHDQDLAAYDFPQELKGDLPDDAFYDALELYEEYAAEADGTLTHEYVVVDYAT